MVEGQRDMKITIEHCCKFITMMLEDGRIPIRYLPIFREYRLMETEESSRFLGYRFPKNPFLFGLNLQYCPWCGRRLPSSLQKEWEDEVLRFDPEASSNMILEADNLPERLLGEEWWRDRNL